MKDDNSPQMHWFGMPEFEQEKQEPFAKINIRFADQAALEKFTKVTGMKITEKTKSAWYPTRNPSDTGMKRWK